ncbi:MAG: hypothetical protein IKF80_06140 [Erysipelotrichaceae bacterium]|nr:hypothetical protein [Erysipelotrichaceae bacterium]
MIKNDFEKYNSDDWLKKEIEREKRVSAWDFDEGHKVRYEHEENCDARNNAQEHEIRHSMRMPVEARRIENNPSRNNPTWFVIDLILFIVLTGFHAYLESRFHFTRDSGAVFFLSFMLLNPVVIIYLIMKKRLMPNLYYIITFLIALAIEIMWLVINLRFVYYIF